MFSQNSAQNKSFSVKNLTSAFLRIGLEQFGAAQICVAYSTVLVFHRCSPNLYRLAKCSNVDILDKLGTAQSSSYLHFAFSMTYHPAYIQVSYRIWQVSVQGGSVHYHMYVYISATL